MVAWLGVSETKSYIFFFFFFFFTFLCVSSALPTYLKVECPSTDLYTPNSTYQGNLQHLLSSLYSIAKYGTGFINISYGDFSDTVYGSFLSRGDDSEDVCLDCVETASREIIIRCPNQKEAITWYDECQLRYSGQSFFSVDADHPNFSLTNIDNISNPDQFSRVLTQKMTTLVSEVAFDPSRCMFAAKEAKLTANQTLYIRGQCTLDLSDSSCHSCLRNSVTHLVSCCGRKVGGRVLRTSCNVRFEMYIFYKRSYIAPTHSPVPLPTVKTADEGEDDLSLSKTLTIAVPAAFAVLVIFPLCCILLTRKAIKKENHEGNDSLPVGPLQFDLDTVRAATDNFSDANKIDEDGYGTVYKGVLSNGEEISVKRLSGNSGDISKAFKKEAFLVAKLQHRNLQRLMGFCSAGGERMLIYEFVSNDSLDTLLFEAENVAQLDLATRLKVIEGVARGLLYLHDDAPLRIIHCDLKFSNILLDRKMNAKISNFGMARGWVDDETLVNPDRVSGTFRHIAPECLMHGQFSAESDVYSFGILILEIISGKRNEWSNRPETAENLLSNAWRCWNEGQAMELIDPTLSQCCQNTEVMKYIHVGLLCAQEEPADRPSMASVLLMLGSDPSTLPVPQSPPLPVSHRAEPWRTDCEHEPWARRLGESSAPVFSINEITFSELSPK